MCLTLMVSTNNDGEDWTTASFVILKPLVKFSKTRQKRKTHESSAL